MQQPNQSNKPYDNTRIEYWTTTLKIVGFFCAGLLIQKAGMLKRFLTSQE